MFLRFIATGAADSSPVIAMTIVTPIAFSLTISSIICYSTMLGLYNWRKKREAGGGEMTQPLIKQQPPVISHVYKLK